MLLIVNSRRISNQYVRKKYTVQSPNVETLSHLGRSDRTWARSNIAVDISEWLSSAGDFLVRHLRVGAVPGLPHGPVSAGDRAGSIVPDGPLSLGCKNPTGLFTLMHGGLMAPNLQLSKSCRTMHVHEYYSYLGRIPGGKARPVCRPRSRALRRWPRAGCRRRAPAARGRCSRRWRCRRWRSTRPTRIRGRLAAEEGSSSFYSYFATPFVGIHAVCMVG